MPELVTLDPGPATADLLGALANYLIAQGIARQPSAAGPGHPLWLEARNGVPAPAEGDDSVETDPDAVLGAFRASGIAPAPYDSGTRIDFVDLWIRVAKAPTADVIEKQLRAALLDKRNWTMDTLTVIESLIYREMQRYGSGPDGFDYVVSYSFQTYTGISPTEGS